MLNRLLLLLLLGNPVGSARANASAPPALEVSLDAPIQVTIAGQPATLAFVAGSVDHLILHDAFLQRVGLQPSTTTKAELNLDGSSKLSGRRGGAVLEIAGLRREQPLLWFPEQSALPLDGTIGIMAVPHPLVRLKTGSLEAPLALRMPLAGDVDSTAYGLVNLPAMQLAVTFNPSIRTPLPLAASAVGVDLAPVLKGRFVGDAWEVEVMPGVHHSVRRLVLDTPLQLGKLRFDALAARIDAAPVGRPERATDKKPTIVLTLSRAQIDAQGCSSLVVDKQQMFIALHCTGPANAEVAGAARVPETTAAEPNLSLQRRPANVASSGLPAIPSPLVTAPAMAPDGFIELQHDQPLAVTIAGKPVELALNTGDLPGVLLNEVAAMRLGLGNRAGQATITYAGRKTAEASGAYETVVALERGAATKIFWLRGYNEELFGGSIELSSLPHERLRLRLSPEEAGARPVRLRLAVPHQRSSRGVTELPGMAGFEVDAALQKRWQLPLISKSLAADLVRILGGRLEGRPWLETLGYRLRRPVRRLIFARPLIVGPLVFKAVAVQIGGTPDESNRLARGQGVLPDADADPDEMIATARVAGTTGRWLGLSWTQLAEQRCTSLAIDKPARSWELVCQGPA